MKRSKPRALCNSYTEPASCCRHSRRTSPDWAKAILSHSRLDAANAYGEVIPDAVVELPKEVFMVDGKIEDGMLEIGNQLPMSDNQGNRLVGVVKAVGNDSVTMDFNHPMAGKALEFSGTIVEVREATPEDMMTGHPAGDATADAETVAITNRERRLRLRLSLKIFRIYGYNP